MDVNGECCHRQHQRHPIRHFASNFMQQIAADHMPAAIFSGDMKPGGMIDGGYLLDQGPVIFRFLLNSLRYGGPTIVPDHMTAVRTEMSSVLSG